MLNNKYVNFRALLHLDNFSLQIGFKMDYEDNYYLNFAA